MKSIYLKEISSFFSNLTGYFVLIIFLLLTSLFMWVFSETSILSYNYASLGQLFSIGPIVFMFLIPAITMQSFAEEKQKQTLEFLMTKPITDIEIILGKYLASATLVLFALLPTLIYYYSVYQLGSPIGNIDNGGVIGSYIGLFLLGAVFVSIGIFVSSLTSNQIVSFIVSTFLCFCFFWAFDFISNLSAFYGKTDSIIKSLGIAFHYDNISKGRIDSKDVIYFFSLIIFFLYLTSLSLGRRNKV
ncbi:MAG: gliding motility-associated ABC transporter permease subunit GldF [Saprospiraceae bacterium]|nr:gliding motility-associated ABC transporter permease subunit GldF [Bacteroidia bacterium]NNL92564.1 gliding motility-associated ABC transporter permease subunit GldF [Saprospiraceae bacterium]